MDGKTIIYFDRNGDKVTDGSITIENGAFTLIDTKQGGYAGQLQIKSQQNFVSGTGSDEILAGTGGADVIRGYAGDDIIRLSAGQDFIDGGAGRDTGTGIIDGGKSYVVTDSRIDGGVFASALLGVRR